jgi:hypothetical protein
MYTRIILVKLRIANEEYTRVWDYGIYSQYVIFKMMENSDYMRI